MTIPSSRSIRASVTISCVWISRGNTGPVVFHGRQSLARNTSLPLHRSGAHRLSMNLRFRYVWNVQAGPVLRLTNLKEVDCASNSVCSEATVVSAFPFVERSNNEFSPKLGGPNATYSPCGNAESRGNWYEVTVDEDACIQILVQASFGIVTAVYDGSCDSLNCLDAEIYSDGDFTFPASNSTTYYVMVGGAYSYDVGDYTLLMTVVVSGSGSTARRTRNSPQTGLGRVLSIHANDNSWAMQCL